MGLTSLVGTTTDPRSGSGRYVASKRRSESRNDSSLERSTVLPPANASKFRRKRKKDVSNNSIETKKKERTKRRKECLENATMEADPVESILLLGEDSDDDDDNDD